MKKILILLLTMALALLCLAGCANEDTEALAAKPVIYLYPESPTEVTVELDYDGRLLYTYPVYQEGWHVFATPDGTITDENGRHYNYLFWEGKGKADYDFSQGFVVAGADTACFLEEKLKYMGLTDEEADDFITYWLPKMQDNPYNLIAFQNEAYTDTAELIVTPEPTTELRVFMAWRPLREPVEVPEQKLEHMEREGFTVVEWGGSQLPE